MNSKIALRLAFLLTLAGSFSALASGDAMTDAPKFSALFIPEPPSQHKHWVPPAADLPTNLISSVQFLFNLGLPDPRGCEYREFEATTGDTSAHTGRITAHGWILSGRSGRRPVFAISWDGLIYPAVKVGKKASLKQDLEALLRADELWRKNLPTNHVIFRPPLSWYSSDWSMSQTNMTVIKIAFLMRLGEGKLARDYWHGWNAARHGGMKQDASDPFREMAAEWVSTQFRRGMDAFMRADDPLALADFHQLSQLWPALEKETSRRGFWRPSEWNGNAPPPYFAFLSPVPELLADEERRRIEPAHPSVLQSGPDKFPEKSKRIAALISDLDQISEAQRMSPGAVWMGENPLVLDLVAEGDNAVDPLLNCLEKDPRLTRSADLDHNQLPYRIVPVRQCAQTALDAILKIHCDSPAEYRAYWQKYRSTPELERWYQTLADDNAGRHQWMQAARNILARTDGKTFYLWRNTPVPDATNGYTYYLVIGIDYTFGQKERSDQDCVLADID
ncbi:MAG TPA: hypothetical protein VH619_05940 [Verrucomicrobiae bacterium]|nr:hypothetical protein [Verrucomicrobiae bacterium]